MIQSLFGRHSERADLSGLRRKAASLSSGSSPLCLSEAGTGGVKAAKRPKGLALTPPGPDSTLSQGELLPPHTHIHLRYTHTRKVRFPVNQYTARRTGPRRSSGRCDPEGLAFALVGPRRRKKEPGQRGRGKMVACVGTLIRGPDGSRLSPADLVCDHLEAMGHGVVRSSHAIPRLQRLFEIVRTLWMQRAHIRLVWLQVYGGLSFLLEDLVSRIATALRLELIMTIHGGAFAEFTRSHTHWVASVLGRASRVSTPSSWLAETLKGVRGDVEYLPNPVAIEDYRFRRRERATPRLLWMRAFHDIYAPSVAVRALAQVKERYPDARLVMAGPDKGALRSTRELTRALGLTGSVEYPGFVGGSKKAKYFDGADIFLNTTRFESFGVSNLEAAASGLCIVSTDVGELSRIWTNGESAVLVPADDPDALAAAVLRVLDNPNLARSLSLGGRRVAERYTWDSLRPAYLSWLGLSRLVTTPKTKGR